MFAANPTPWMVLISLILAINVVFLFTVVKRNYMHPATPAVAEPIEPVGDLNRIDDPLAEASALIQTGGHAPTASALANLIRALYLDQSTFTFNMLEALDPQQRQLASQLIAAHLDNRYRADEWERAYETVKVHVQRNPKTIPTSI